ncbi:MAG: hypothetical protein AAF403_06460, partial [Pseudomonadota bacterium]
RRHLPIRFGLRAKFGSKSAADQVYSEIIRAGKLEKIPFHLDEITITPNSLSAHALIQWAQLVYPKQTKILVEMIFASYFQKGENISSIIILYQIFKNFLTAIDVENHKVNKDELQITNIVKHNDIKAPEDFETKIIKKHAPDVLKIEKQGREIGIQGVPFFIINNQFSLSGAQTADIWQSIFDIG